MVCGLILTLLVTSCTQPSIETPIPAPASEATETPSQAEITEPSQTLAKEPATTTESEPTPKPTTSAPERQQGEEYYIDGERYILPTFEELERERDGLTRNYPKTVNSVYESGSHGHRLIRSSLPELRDLGVNTIYVQLSYDYDRSTNELVLGSVRPDNQRPFVGEKREREYIDRVVKAKKAGFAVSMQPKYFGGREVKTIPDLDAFDEFALQQAKKWAQIAEEYQVEYFSPLNEYEELMAGQGLSGATLVERVNSWNQKVLAEVRPIFTGKIFLKVSQRGLGSFSAQSAWGSDIFMITFTLSSREMLLEELRESIQRNFSEAQLVAKRDDVEWMVSFFLRSEGRSEEERVELFRLVLEEYNRALEGKNKPVGFTFTGWEMPPDNVKNTGIVPFLKQFFSEI